MTSSTGTSTPRSKAQRGTAYVRLVCSVSVRPARLSPTLAARTLRGMLDELMLTSARAKATYARLIDVAIVPTIQPGALA